MTSSAAESTGPVSESSPSELQSSEGSYVLSELELYNWGPFQGLHRAEFDPRGSAIIGQTGSGKTTLVDAIMTMIAARPLYNLASTGGHESDRDLVSYVRGVSGEGNQSDDQHIARSGATLTGISLVFGDGRHSVRLSALFWFEGSSSSLRDLKRLWIFTRQREPSLVHWLELHREYGVKGLKQRAKELDDSQLRDSKKAYLALINRFFEVGENAFSLLNRAAGLKQLNSIDALFRELVLDDRSAFEQAAEVIQGFDTLKEIHGELETARDQQRSLLPIEQEERNRRAREQELDRLEQIKALLTPWFAERALHGWNLRRDQLQKALSELLGRLEMLHAEQQHQEQQVEARHQDYLQQGGGNIEQLEQQIQQQQRILRDCRRSLQDYQALVAALELDLAHSAAALATNQRQARQLREQLELQRDGAEDLAFQQGGQLKGLQQQRDELHQELQQARREAGSNIPGRFLQFKHQLAEALDLESEQLAYVAELVEVKGVQADWRGAIERAIGSHRLRLVLPGEHMREALAWVNARDNRLHVRLLDAGQHASQADFREHGFTRKLNYRKHPLREAVKSFLADIDLHCVDSSDQLHRTPYAITREGLVSGRQGRFDKQDQKALDADWLTGFDNRDLLRRLEQQLQQQDDRLQTLQGDYASARERHRSLENHLQLIERLDGLEFDKIDTASAEALLQQFEAQLAQLQAPDSDLQNAREQWQQAKQRRDETRAQIEQQQRNQGQLTDQLHRAEQRIQLLERRSAGGLDETARSLGDERFGSIDDQALEQIDELERQAAAKLQGEINGVNAALQTSINKLIRLMGVARHKDTGALAEVGTEIRDIPAYLEQLEQLTKEALPEKLDRFLAYLNKSSDEGVTQLLSSIENEVSLIEERIEQLNRTLIQVDFQPGRYLLLEPRRVRHETLVSLQRLQRELRSASLVEDQGESHYRALVALIAQLREHVERKATVAARALLDPRHRLQFFVQVLSREDHQLIEIRTGSKGGSGGEKEIIASYVLTASLSYALCPEGATRPLFGSVILDEAFSKSSQAVAARIIEALRQFGLRPLFITPNKEMRLLRAHTRSAVLVHRRGQRAATASLSWEEIDRQAQRRRVVGKEG